MLLTTVPVSVAPAPVLDPTTTGKGSQSLCSPRARRRTSRLISIRSLSRTGVIERARLTEPIRIRGFLYPQFPAIVTRVRTQTIGSFKVAKGSHYLFSLTFPLYYFLG
jgi:hypothetical protein